MAKVTLDHGGWNQVLNSSEVADAVAGLAEEIATTARALLPSGTDVVVDQYRTDRAAASVTIRDVKGKLWQVRDGVLTRAAAAHGAEVKAKAV